MRCFNLREQARTLRSHRDLEEKGYVMEVIHRQGGMRLVLVVLSPGGVIPRHVAPGDITIHVLEGDVTVRGEEAAWQLAEGELVALRAGEPHAVGSGAGGAFLLTINA